MSTEQNSARPAVISSKENQAAEISKTKEIVPKTIKIITKKAH